MATTTPKLATTLPVSPIVPAAGGPALQAGVVQVNLGAETGQVVTGGEFGLATTMGPNWSYQSYADPAFQKLADQYPTDLLRHNWELHTMMDLIYPSRASASKPDFSRIDNYLDQQANLKGFFDNSSGTQIVTLGLPSWLNIADPADQALYASMVKGIAQHFIDKGEPIPNYELVNEPDGHLNVTDLAHTFNAVADALHSLDPSTKLGGLSESWYHGDDMATFYKIAGKNIGFVSWHQYVEGSGGAKSDQQVVNDAMGVQGQAQTVRAQMRAAGIPDSVPLFLGEYNVDGGEYTDPDNANMVGAIAAAATTYGMVHSNANFTMGALWDVQNDSAYSVFGHAGDYRINPVGMVLADLTAYMPGNLVQTTMPSNTPGLVGYATKDGQRFSVALIDTDLSQSYTVDLSKSGLPTTGLYRVEVSPSSPQGTKTAVSDLSHVSVAAGSVVIITNEAPHGGTELNGTTSTAPASASAGTPDTSTNPTPPAAGGSATTAAGAGTSGSGTGGTKPDQPPATSSGTATTPSGTTTGGTGPSTAGTATDPSSTSPSGSTTQATGTSATVPPTASTGAGAASTSGGSTKAGSTGQFSVANGQIIDPDGNPFVARGINLFPGQVDAATILKTFPGINAVRVAATPGTDPAVLDALVQGLTPKGVVVVIEDHSSSGGNPNTLSGQALADQASAYAKWASRYGDNTRVWFGSPNEPDNTANLAAVPAQEAAVYNAIRGTGSQAMVLMEMRGGFTNDAAQQSASTYAGMHNIIFDAHYYGWKVNQSTDPATIAKGLQDEIANAQSVKSADGKVPVVIGETGVSTTGSGGYDADGLQVVQAVFDSGHGAFAWAWNAGTDALTNSNGSLTDFGQLVAKHISAGASTSTSPVAPTTTPNPGDPAPSNPAPTSPAPASSSGSTPPAPVGTGADTLVLTLSEDAYQGDARFQLTVDGKAVGPAQSVTALHGKGQGEAFTFKGDWSGAHRFGVTFTNDAWGGSAATDRNLYVDKVVLDGTQVEGAAALYKNGTVWFGTGSAGGAAQDGTPVTASDPISLALTPGASPSGTTDAAATPADMLTVTGNDGGTAAVPLIATGSRTDKVGGGTVGQVVKDSTDTLTTSGAVKSEAATLGGGTRKLILVNPRSMTLTGGSGTDTVTADGGANRFVAGSGSLDVTGGPGANEFVLHAGAGSLTVEDFDASKGDELLLDQSLQGALKQVSDGHGGALLSFGAGTGTVDLIGRANLDLSGLRFV